LKWRIAKTSPIGKTSEGVNTLENGDIDMLMITVNLLLMIINEEERFGCKANLILVRLSNLTSLATVRLICP
jgi:hypothetical protein